MEIGKERTSRPPYIAILVAAVVVGAAIVGYYSFLRSPQVNPSIQQLQALVNSLQRDNAALRNQLAGRAPAVNGTLFGLNPVAIYQRDSPSVVTVEGVEQTSSGNTPILGSGFVVSYQGNRIVTNYHVVHNVVSITVTFSDGNAYPASVLGTDAYVDLAVLSVTAPASEFHPLSLGFSSQLRVGEPVIAIGNPFGLSSSETFGIVSQLGRTLSESLAGNFAIADVIQFSAPINPGNSGGPLLDANGTVVGITTAVVASSQGVGFAIPSDVISREIASLVTTGTYTLHSLLGIAGADMSYWLAKAVGTNVTYGVLIQNLTSGGPADKAGLKGGSSSLNVQGTLYSIGGDLIVSINGTKIVGLDSLSAYLQEKTIPGETIAILVIRNGQPTTVDVVLGTRPPPPSA